MYRQFGNLTPDIPRNMIMEAIIAKIERKMKQDMITLKPGKKFRGTINYTMEVVPFFEASNSNISTYSYLVSQAQY